MKRYYPIFDKRPDVLVVQEALRAYILPDYMNGYNDLHDLLQDLEYETKYTVEPKDLGAFNRLWKNKPAIFVETIACEWCDMIADNMKMFVSISQEGKQ